MTLVFLHGVGASLFGFEHVRAIDAWVPLFLFSVLFGLSMDYQVFLLSRIKEHHDASGDTSEAVASGVASTARIITGAALIIIVVFIGFALGQLVMFQQMGFGVAVALLLDATVIRVVLLPSLLRLLGERVWYLPRALTWLPRVELGHGRPKNAGYGKKVGPARRAPGPSEGAALRVGLRGPPLAGSATTPAAGTGTDDHAVGGIHDRLVLLVPAHAVMLVGIAAEHLDDLSSTGRLAVDTTAFDPVARLDAGENGLGGHLIISLAPSNRPFAKPASVAARSLVAGIHRVSDSAARPPGRRRELHLLAECDGGLMRMSPHP